ncbi:hypothetical protein [Rhodobacter sp. 24-YEA-8]|uniref:hypothetical protein n=1 Tax=Rhodobacter sp. 24-YEA-8 TaxID=1884310 RepID=UPI00115F9A0C|nr:hypothetical protein [Rhodobacter sp. 24-YEA-8]
MTVASLWPLAFAALIEPPKVKALPSGMCRASMASTPPRGVPGSTARQLSVPAPFTLILLCE